MTRCKTVNIHDIINLDVYIGQKIGINLSGGADSSLLLYLLAKNGATDIRVNALQEYRTGRDVIDIVDNVLNTISNLLDIPNIEKRYYYQNEKNLNTLFDPPINDLKNRITIAHYSGITSTPEDPEFTSNDLLETHVLTVRDPTVIREIYDPTMTAIGLKMIRPFYNLSKKDIAEIYKKENLLETLFPITRSCTNVGTYNKQNLLHCGHCWWCCERKWAFGRLQ